MVCGVVPLQSTDKGQYCSDQSQHLPCNQLQTRDRLTSVWVGRKAVLLVGVFPRSSRSSLTRRRLPSQQCECCPASCVTPIHLGLLDRVLYLCWTGKSRQSPLSKSIPYPRRFNDWLIPDSILIGSARIKSNHRVTGVSMEAEGLVPN